MFVSTKRHESHKYRLRADWMPPYCHILESLDVTNCDVKMAHFSALDAKNLSCIDSLSLTLLPWWWIEALMVFRGRDGFVVCVTDNGVSFPVIYLSFRVISHFFRYVCWPLLIQTTFYICRRRIIRELFRFKHFQEFGTESGSSGKCSEATWRHLRPLSSLCVRWT